MREIIANAFISPDFSPEPVAKIINNKELRKKMEEKLGR